MKLPRNWVLIAGLVATVVAMLASSLSASTLALVGLALLCPVTMFFGMRGMGMNHVHCHSEDHRHSEPKHEADTKSSREAA